MIARSVDEDVGVAEDEEVRRRSTTGAGSAGIYDVVVHIRTARSLGFMETELARYWDENCIFRFWGHADGGATRYVNMRNDDGVPEMMYLTKALTPSSPPS